MLADTVPSLWMLLNKCSLSFNFPLDFFLKFNFGFFLIQVEVKPSQKSWSLASHFGNTSQPLHPPFSGTWDPPHYTHQNSLWTMCTLLWIYKPQPGIPPGFPQLPDYLRAKIRHFPLDHFLDSSLAPFSKCVLEPAAKLLHSASKNQSVLVTSLLKV